MSWLVHTKQLTEDQSNILTYIQRGYKHKQTKEGNKQNERYNYKKCFYRCNG
jgi:hypothetical protein